MQDRIGRTSNINMLKISCKTRIELMHLKQQIDYFTLYGFFIQLSHGSDVIIFLRFEFWKKVYGFFSHEMSGRFSFAHEQPSQPYTAALYCHHFLTRLVFSIWCFKLVLLEVV